MKALSHPLLRRGLGALLGLVAMAGAEATLADGGAGASGPFYGRWTISEHNPVFTARGRLFKTIDIKPCGDAVCGVSVDYKGQCGARLFRTVVQREDGSNALQGHIQWGDAVKNISIYLNNNTDSADGVGLSISNGVAFSERSVNMPKFFGIYRRIGQGACTAA